MNCSCSDGRVRCVVNPEMNECPTPPPRCPDGTKPRQTAESCCNVCVASCINPGRCEDAPPIILRRPLVKIKAFVGQPFSYSFTVMGVNMAYEIAEPINGATYTANKIVKVDKNRAVEVFEVTVTGFAEGVYNICVSNDVGTAHVVTLVQYVKRKCLLEDKIIIINVFDDVRTFCEQMLWL